MTYGKGMSPYMWRGKGTSKGRRQQLILDPSKSVWIGCVPGAATWKSLQQLADQAGRSKWVEIFRGRGKGTAVVVYSTAEEATRAVSMLNGMALEGGSIVADLWVTKPLATSSSDRPTLKLEVATISGENIELHSKSSATVADLTQLISSKTKWPSITMRLLHDGLPLASAASLEECGIKDNTSLSLVFDTIQILLTGCDDGQARLWKIDSGKCACTVEATGWSDEAQGKASIWILQPSIAMSPDGSTFLTGCATGAVKLWCAETGNCLRTLSAPSSPEVVPNDAPRKRVAFSRDGDTALVGCAMGGLQMFKLNSEEKDRRLTTYGVNVFALSGDGMFVVVVPTNEVGAKLLDVTTGDCLLTVAGHIGGILAVAFAPNGRSFVTGSDDASAKVWSVGKGECLKTLCREPYETGNFGDFGPHYEDVQVVAYSPDGSLIVTGHGMEKECQVWRVDSGECVLTLRGQRGVSGAAFSSDGLTIVTGAYRAAKVWCIESGELKQEFEHPDEVCAVALCV